MFGKDSCLGGLMENTVEYCWKITFSTSQRVRQRFIGEIRKFITVWFQVSSGCCVGPTKKTIKIVNTSPVIQNKNKNRGLIRLPFELVHLVWYITLFHDVMAGCRRSVTRPFYCCCSVLVTATVRRHSVWILDKNVNIVRRFRRCSTRHCWSVYMNMQNDFY